jgi:hypothetical protein
MDVLLLETVFRKGNSKTIFRIFRRVSIFVMTDKLGRTKQHFFGSAEGRSSYQVITVEIQKRDVHTR